LQLTIRDGMRDRIATKKEERSIKKEGRKANKQKERMERQGLSFLDKDSGRRLLLDFLAKGGGNGDTVNKRLTQKKGVTK